MHRSFFAGDTVRRLALSSLPTSGTSPTVKPEEKRRSMRSRVLLVACFSLLLGACAESTGPIVSGPSENPGGQAAINGQEAGTETTNVTVRNVAGMDLDKASTIQAVHRKSNYAVAF